MIKHRLFYLTIVLLCFSMNQVSFASKKAVRLEAVVYQSPNDGDNYVLQEAKFIIRLKKPFLQTHPLSSLRAEVNGSRSGSHNGAFILTDDNETTIFTPSSGFALDEDVTVKISSVNSDLTTTISSFSFHTTKLTYLERLQATNDLDKRYEDQARSKMLLASQQKKESSIFQKLVPLTSPTPNVTISTKPAKGRFFIGAINREIALPPPAPQPTNSAMIVENWGAIYHSSETPISASIGDFKVQPHRNSITYFQRIAGGDQSQGISYCIYYEMDKNYNRIDSFSCGNGYPTDAHDFQILKNGHSLIASYDGQKVDMTKVISDPQADTAALVYGAIVQELDSLKNVVFQWRSWDHFQITDCADDISLTTKGLGIDYVHINSLEQDHDGNILISNRHMEEVTKINRTTGEIIWRFGGKHNQIAVADSPLPFSHQHDARRIANGHITVFDNGNLHVPPFTRALEYSIDEQSKQANLVWSFQDTIDGSVVYSEAAGNAQRLENGNTVIGWGIIFNPTVTEVDPSGKKVFEASLANNFNSYRSFKFNWQTGVGLLGVDDTHPTITSTPTISLFPNPATTRATVDFTVPNTSNVSIELFDILGRELTSQQKYFSSGGNYSAEIEFGSITPGTYYVKVTINGITTTEKLIVQ